MICIVFYNMVNKSKRYQRLTGCSCKSAINIVMSLNTTNIFIGSPVMAYVKYTKEV